MKNGIKFLCVLILMCGCSTHFVKIEFNKSLEKDYLNHFPNTKPEEIVSCSSYFNVDSEFDEAVECFEQTKQIKLTDQSKPTCYVILQSSKDLTHDSDGLNVKQTPQITYSVDSENKLSVELQLLPVMGMYVVESRNIFIMENYDVDFIYKHELFHLFLNRMNIKDENNEHSDVIWKTCTTPTYERSRKAKIYNWFAKLKSLFF